MKFSASVFIALSVFISPLWATKYTGDAHIVAYLQALRYPSEKVSEKIFQVARDWDLAILKNEIVSDYIDSAAASEPTAEYDCVCSRYETDELKITTKQTFCVWLVEVETKSEAAKLKQPASQILKLSIVLI